MSENRIWDENYLLAVLNIGEGEKYEFKGSNCIDLTKGAQDINRSVLAKALSAFANSGGGYLIIGIDDKTKKVDNGGVNIRIKENGTKAWLEDILPPLVDPPLRKINIHEIKGESTDSLIAPGHAVYVVEIHDSTLAPHQSTIDNRYYGRVSGKSHPLGHRMVQDIFNRKQYPNIEITFNYGFVNDDDPNLILQEGQHPILIVHCHNIGSVFAKYVNVFLHIPKYLLEEEAIRTLLNGTYEVLENGINYVRVIKENVHNESYTVEDNIIGRGPGRYVPILPGQIHNFKIPLCKRFVDYQYLFTYSSPIMMWELYADNAPRKEGRIYFQSIKKYDIRNQ